MSVPDKNVGNSAFLNSDQLNNREPKELNAKRFPSNTLFVVGSEGKGMKESIAKLCSEQISIPGGDSFVDSLNLSVAVGIVLSNLINKQNYK